MIRRTRRNIRRASGDISTVTGTAAGVGLGMVCGGVAAFGGYFLGQGIDYFLSETTIPYLWSNAAEAGDMARYAVPAGAGLGGFVTGVSYAPRIRENVRNYIRRLF